MLRQDVASRLLVGISVTVALLMYIMFVPDPFMTPILLLFGAGIIRIYVAIRKVKVDKEISPTERFDIVYYAMLGLLGMLFGGILIDKLYEPPIPTAISNFINIAYATIIVSILYAISEEIYFRGELFELFNTQFGPGAAMPLSSAFFTVYHLKRYGASLDSLAYVFIGGLILAWIALRTQRVLTPMLAHVLNNLLGTAFLMPALIILCVFVFVKHQRGRIKWT